MAKSEKAAPPVEAVAALQEESPEVTPAEVGEVIIPGGHYYTAAGVLVNCENQPIAEDGTILEPVPLLRG